MRIMKKNKLIAGFGINDADYNVQHYDKIDGKIIVVWSCPYYIKWKSMIYRCYSEAVHLKQPTYLGCSVYNKWHRFTEFKSWMETQDWQGKELDKDILFPGNKLYSPDTCVFVDKRVNIFLIDCAATRGEWPIGVYFCKRSKKYKAVCCDAITGKQIHLGYYATAGEAHKAWLKRKLEQAYIIAAQQTDERVAKALIDRYENYGNFTKGA